MRGAAFILIGLLFCTRAAAADLTVNVRTPSGEPIADAVVEVHPAAGASAQGVRFPWPQEMGQENLQFAPFVLVTPVGGEVAFPNRDGVRHHVYSFSPAKRFELKLYGKGEAPKVRFEKAGVVALGCNIHDSMIAFIKVVDTPYAIKTGASGSATLHGMPAGPATLRVWHPYLRGADNEVVRQIVLRDGAAPETVTAEVRKPAARRGAY
jgi:plastocyanin